MRMAGQGCHHLDIPLPHYLPPKPQKNFESSPKNFGKIGKMSWKGRSGLHIVLPGDLK